MHPPDLSKRMAGNPDSPTPDAARPGNPSAPGRAASPAPARDGIPVLSAAAAIGYAVETLRALLSNQLNPETNAVLTVLEERSAQIQRDLPDVLRAADGAAVVADVHPARSVNRQISKGTNLVDGPPWRLFEPLV